MNRVRYTLVAATVAALSQAAVAQQMPRDVLDTGVLPITMLLCELPIEHADMSVLPAGHVHEPIMRSTGGPTATFQVTYSGFTPQAQAAFQAALDIWATHIASAVPIKIQANWVVLEWPEGMATLDDVAAASVMITVPARTWLLRRAVTLARQRRVSQASSTGARRARSS